MLICNSRSIRQKCDNSQPCLTTGGLRWGRGSVGGLGWRKCAKKKRALQSRWIERPGDIKTPTTGQQTARRHLLMAAFVGVFRHMYTPMYNIVQRHDLWRNRRNWKAPVLCHMQRSREQKVSLACKNWRVSFSHNSSCFGVGRGAVILCAYTYTCSPHWSTGGRIVTCVLR